MSTFQLTDEGIDEPVEGLRQSLSHHGVDRHAFRVPGFGETVFIPRANGESAP